MSALDIDLLDYLRLEVETDPTGLVNLVANPSGDLGGWGWLTPLASSAITLDAGLAALNYYRTVAGASYFTTELMPIAAGQYAAASYGQVAVANAYHKVRFEWYDAAGALLSSSAQSGLVAPAGSSGAEVVNNYGPLQAPASTAYLKLRIDLYTSGGANPAGSHFFKFRHATVAKAATSGALGASRTNLVANPSFETNVTLWTPGSGTALTRVTTVHSSGAASMRMVATAPKSAVVTSAQFNVTGGVDYQAQADLFDSSGVTRGPGIPKVIGFNWYTAAGAYLSTTNAPANTAATPLALTATAPAGAGKAELVITGGASGTWYLDAVKVEAVQVGLPTGYFDGATAAGGGWTYSWTGTAHLSASVATSSNLAYVEPVPYLNILGGSSSLDINRQALDVGVIQALIKDASLDPAVADLIRPGRSVRLRALNDDSATWEVLAQGTLDKGRVAYDLRKPLAKQATISLATVDVNQVLANTNRPDGVATIADLPYVLEGARVPWNVNGSGNQVASATIASSNDQASALDQVLLARDSDLGYAWTTKEGVLTAYDDRTLDYYGTGTALLDESVYSGLDVTFDPDDCINEVMVNLRRFGTSGEVEEVAFGPYRDAASIDEWGVHQKTFTVHGIAEASIAAYAADILAANAQPSRRINQVTIPIRGAADLVKTKALLDLYAKVRVTNTDKALDQTLRPTGIRHLISPKRWTMVLTFEQLDTVATPIPTTPQGGNGLIPVRAYRMAAGRFNFTFANVNSVQVAVTFPVGRFSQTPVVTHGLNGGTNVTVCFMTAGGASPTGQTMVCTARDAANLLTTTINAQWLAIQMSETSGTG